MPRSDSQKTLQLLVGLRTDFDSLRQRGRLVRIRLIHRATNAEAEGVIGWPPWDGATTVPCRSAGYRESRQNLDENGNPKFIEPPMVDLEGKPIVDSNGKGIDLTWPADRTIELAGDGDTIQQLQALCDRGGRVAKECCDIRATQSFSDFQFREPSEQWWSLVFELAWSGRHPLLTAKRSLWQVGMDDEVTYFPYDLEELRRLPPDIPGCTVPSNWLKRLPEAYVSEIDDAVAACVDSCDVLLNSGTGTGDAHKSGAALPELTEPPKQTNRYDALERVWGIVETRLRLSGDSPITEQQKEEAYRAGEKEILSIFGSDQTAMGHYIAACGLSGSSFDTQKAQEFSREVDWVKKELRLRIQAFCCSRASEKSKEADTSDAPASQSTKGPRRKRGRPPDTDAEADKKIYEAWQSGSYKNYAELARAKNLSEEVVSHAYDRHRKRLKRPSK